MRYRDGRRSLCLSLAVGLPADLHVLRDRPDALRAQPDGRRRSSTRRCTSAAWSPVDHAVFMGMGEPMMNLDAVLDACGRLPDVGITHRRTAISTVGWIPGIDALADRADADPPGAFAARADDALRCEIMPVNDRYPLADVLAACRRFYEAKRRLVFVEYVMLAGVNDRYEQAVALAQLARSEDLQGQPDSVQPDRACTTAPAARRSPPSRPCSRSTACDATVRLTRGRDIDAACGQLAAKACAWLQRAGRHAPRVLGGPTRGGRRRRRACGDPLVPRASPARRPDARSSRRCAAHGSAAAAGQASSPRSTPSCGLPRRTCSVQRATPRRAPLGRRLGRAAAGDPRARDRVDGLVRLASSQASSATLGGRPAALRGVRGAGGGPARPDRRPSPRARSRLGAARIWSATVPGGATDHRTARRDVVRRPRAPARGRVPRTRPACPVDPRGEDRGPDTSSVSWRPDPDAATSPHRIADLTLTAQIGDAERARSIKDAAHLIALERRRDGGAVALAGARQRVAARAARPRPARASSDRSSTTIDMPTVVAPVPSMSWRAPAPGAGLEPVVDAARRGPQGPSASRCRRRACTVALPVGPGHAPWRPRRAASRRPCARHEARRRHVWAGHGARRGRSRAPRAGDLACSARRGRAPPARRPARAEELAVGEARARCPNAPVDSPPRCARRGLRERPHRRLRRASAAAAGPPPARASPAFSRRSRRSASSSGDGSHCAGSGRSSSEARPKSLRNSGVVR